MPPAPTPTFSAGESGRFAKRVSKTVLTKGRAASRSCRLFRSPVLLLACFCSSPALFFLYERRVLVIMLSERARPVRASNSRSLVGEAGDVEWEREACAGLCCDPIQEGDGEGETISVVGFITIRLDWRIPLSPLSLSPPAFLTLLYIYFNLSPINL
jgi:hypothetical protein